MRKATPFNRKNISHIGHAQMCLNYLAAAADLVDFMEYGNNDHILEKIGLNAIYGILNKSIFIYIYNSIILYFNFF